MSHNQSARRQANFGKNPRSVWIEEEGEGFIVLLKHGIRVEERVPAATEAEAQRIAEAMVRERGAEGPVRRMKKPRG